MGQRWWPPDDPFDTLFSPWRLPDPDQILWVCDAPPARFLPCRIVGFEIEWVDVLILASAKAGRVMRKEWGDLVQGEIPTRPLWVRRAYWMN